MYIYTRMSTIYSATCILSDEPNQYAVAFKEGEIYSVEKPPKGYAGVMVSGLFYNDQGHSEGLTRVDTKESCIKHLRIDGIKTT